MLLHQPRFAKGEADHERWLKRSGRFDTKSAASILDMYKKPQSWVVLAEGAKTASETDC